MNKFFLIFFLCTFLLININCGKQEGPNPSGDNNHKSEIANTLSVQDSIYINKPHRFYELEESIEDIQAQISQLQTRVMEYEYSPPETDYTQKLKELINESPPKHKITLTNGTIIEGNIQKDRVNHSW